MPLKGGIDDESYETVFRPVIEKVMEKFRPGAIVLQCGADSLAKDRLGCFNLTIKGHGRCVSFVKGFGIPTLVLGGGGYNIRSVARCWVYETALLLDTEIDDNIPFNDYWLYFEPDHKLHFPKQAKENKNTKEYLEKVKIKVFENLRSLTGAPSVQIQEVPPMYYISEGELDDDVNPDMRRISDKAQAQGEFFNGNKDQGMESMRDK